MNEPTLIVLGGANGSGKTTIAREYISVENIPYLGADQIAYELNSENVESVAIEAGRLFIKKIADYLQEGQSFIVESTLSGLSLRKWIGKAKDRNYFIKIGFIYLDSPELCVDRVSARVSKGGHHVPAEDIRRRFHRSNLNFWNHYRNLADDWKLYNNTGREIILVAMDDGNGISVGDSGRYQKWLEMATKT